MASKLCGCHFLYTIHYLKLLSDLFMFVYYLKIQVPYYLSHYVFYLADSNRVMDGLCIEWLFVIGSYIDLDSWNNYASWIELKLKLEKVK